MDESHFYNPIVDCVHRLPGSFIRDFFARALWILLLTHSPYMYYDHTIHMSHLGRSGTLLDPPNTYVSNPHAAVRYTNTEYCLFFISAAADTLSVSCVAGNIQSNVYHYQRNW